MPPPAPFWILDGHNDSLLRFAPVGVKSPADFFQRSETGHLDLPRALEGGLAAGLFAVFVPAPPPGPGEPPREEPIPGKPAPVSTNPPIPFDHACRVTDNAIQALLDLEQASQGRFAVVRTVDQLTEQVERGIFAAVLHFEGAEAIAPDLSNLEAYYQRGLRSVGLVWSRPNAFGHGVFFQYPGSPDCGPGLTAAGRDLVRACNERGILIDLAHLNEKGFWEVAGLSTKPLVVTHGNAHALCPCSRNLTDAQIDAVGRSGGVVGINFCNAFLRADGTDNADTPLSRIADHVKHIADRIGADHVALGSDFDGAQLPKELDGADKLSALAAELRTAGFTNGALAAILHGNWLRVLRETWKD